MKFFKSSNPYKTLDSSSPEQPIQEKSPYEDMCKGVVKPTYCDRCLTNNPNIRVIDKQRGCIEFVCYSCKSEDKRLNKLVVKHYN